MNRLFSKVLWRLHVAAFQVEIADFGDGLFATMFDEQAQRLLGYDGAYVNELDPTECDKLLNSVQFQSKIFVLRVKMESYQVKQRSLFMCRDLLATDINNTHYVSKVPTLKDAHLPKVPKFVLRLISHQIFQLVEYGCGYAGFQVQNLS